MEMSDKATGQEDCLSKPDGAQEEIAGGEKLTTSQRPGGKKRMVAVFVAFVGAGYSVSLAQPSTFDAGCRLANVHLFTCTAAAYGVRLSRQSLCPF